MNFENYWRNRAHQCVFSATLSSSWFAIVFWNAQGKRCVCLYLSLLMFFCFLFMFHLFSLGRILLPRGGLWSVLLRPLPRGILHLQRSVNIQGTFSQHSRNVQSTFRERHVAHKRVQVVCKSVHICVAYLRICVAFTSAYLQHHWGNAITLRFAFSNAFPFVIRLQYTLIRWLPRWL